MLPKLVSKGSLSCHRSLTLAALAGHQRQKKTVMLFKLAHLRPAMGIIQLKRCSNRLRHTLKYTLVLSWNGQNTTQNTHTNTHFLTLVRQLANIGGDSHVQHVIDSCVNIVSSLDIMFTVGLVALLMAAVLQTVPLQVLECRCATWGPGGRRGKCWLTVTSPSLTRSPSSLVSDGLWWAVCLSLSVPFHVLPVFSLLFLCGPY